MYIQTYIYIYVHGFILLVHAAQETTAHNIHELWPSNNQITNNCTSILHINASIVKSSPYNISAWEKHVLLIYVYCTSHYSRAVAVFKFKWTVTDTQTCYHILDELNPYCLSQTTVATNQCTDPTLSLCYTHQLFQPRTIYLFHCLLPWECCVWLTCVIGLLWTHGAAS